MTHFSLIQEIECHENIIFYILPLSDGRLASCSCDYTIKIHSISPKYCNDITILGHKGSVTSVTEIKQTVIASSSFDDTIKIWNISKSKYKLLHTLTGHISIVTKVIYVPHKNVLISCSQDKTIRVWDLSLKQIQTTHILNEHIHYIENLYLLPSNNNILISGAITHSTLFFYSINSNYKCIHSIKKVPCCSNDSILEISEGRIIVGGLDRISVVDCKSYEIITVVYIQGLKKVFSFEKYTNKDNDIIICGCFDRIALISFTIGQCEYIMGDNSIHEGGIQIIKKVKDDMYVSGSIDGYMKIWNVKIDL